TEKVISPTEFGERKQVYLQMQKQNKDGNLNITNIQLQTLQLQAKVSELKQQEQIRRVEMLATIEASMNQLESSLKEWEQSYMIKAPIPGKVALLKYWATHQYLKAGEEILTIIPDNAEYFGRANARMEK